MADDLTHLRAILDASFDGECLADERHRLTFEELGHAVRTTAVRLKQLGVSRGDIVAAVLSNRVELPISMYAAWGLGAAVTPVNPALTDTEIAYQLGDASVKVAVVEQETADRLPGDVATLSAEGLAEPGRDASEEWIAPGPDERALVVYTSGTTGRPKGVVLDHANLSAMTSILATQVDITPADRCLLILPLFHVNAIMLSVVAPLAVGASSVIVEHFDAHAFWPIVERERPTYFSGVPAVYFFLTILPEEIQPDTSSLRFAICGAAPMPPDAIEAFENRYGVPIVEGYGLSEATVALTVNPIAGVRKPGTVGLPLQGVAVTVVDDRGHAVPAGSDGEIVAQGPTVMRGYLGRPEATAAALEDGWLHTGDVGHFDDDGYLVLVDRLKDLIIRGGENIAPSEVELVLEAHPAVQEAAVVGRAHPLMGEEPVAFVVPQPDHELDPDAIVEYCQAHLARFKVPKALIVADSLPRNMLGKVTKQQLRERLVSR